MWGGRLSLLIVQVAQGSASPSKCIVGIFPQAHVAFPSLSSHRGTSFGGQVKIAVAVPCEVSNASRNVSSAAWDCSVRAGSPRPCCQHYPNCAILLYSALFFPQYLLTCSIQHTSHQNVSSMRIGIFPIFVFCCISSI